MTKKIRTLSELQDRLDEESSWRVKEIKSLSLSIKSARQSASDTIVRAAVVLFYSHWEGFIKRSSNAYIDYVSTQKLKIADLAIPLLAIFARHQHVQAFKSTRYKFLVNMFHEILTKSSEKAKLIYEVKTSNLNYELFEDVATVLGIDLSSYATKANFIDASLLKSRNDIAHGGKLSVKPDVCQKYGDEVLGLIQMYKNDILNAACLKTFRSPSSCNSN